MQYSFVHRTMDTHWSFVLVQNGVNRINNSNWIQNHCIKFEDFFCSLSPPSTIHTDATLLCAALSHCVMSMWTCVQEAQRTDRIEWEKKRKKNKKSQKNQPNWIDYLWKYVTVAEGESELTVLPDTHFRTPYQTNRNGPFPLIHVFFSESHSMSFQ